MKSKGYIAAILLTLIISLSAQPSKAVGLRPLALYKTGDMVTANDTKNENTTSQNWYRQDSRKQGKHFEVGIGFVAGSGYHNALVDAYSSSYEISGGSGGIDIEAGFGMNLTPQIQLCLRLRMLAFPVKIEGYSGFPPSEKASIAFLPGVAGKYFFNAINRKFYAGGELSLVSWASDLERIAAEPKGLGMGIAVGYAFDKEYEFEMGYLWVPFKVSSSSHVWDCYYCQTQPESANFGGINFVVRRRFDL